MPHNLARLNLFSEQTGAFLVLPATRPEWAIKPGELLMLEGVGGGFTWGAVLLNL